MSEPVPHELPPTVESYLSSLMTDLGWFLIQIAARGAAVWLLWNLLVPVLYPTAPSLTFGNGFAIVLLIKVLFGNLDGHSKFQTRHLFDMSRNLQSLILNQAHQNNSILYVLKELHNRNAAPDERLETVVLDETEETNYNDASSEKN